MALDQQLALSDVGEAAASHRAKIPSGNCHHLQGSEMETEVEVETEVLCSEVGNGPEGFPSLS